MVAGARLLEPLEVGVEVVLREEGGAVDAGEHRLARIATPVGARGGHQLERLDALGARAVRAAAEVGEGTVAVERHGGLAEVFDELDLVALALVLEALDGLLGGNVRALERLVGLDVLAHLLLDALEVGVRDLHSLGEVEVVVEAVLDRRADGHLSAWVELEHGLGEHVGGVVAEEGEGVRAAVGDDLDRLAVVQRRRQVAQIAVHLDRQRRPRQTLADRARGIRAGGAVLELELLAVGEGDVHADWKLARRRSSFSARSVMRCRSRTRSCPSAPSSMARPGSLMSSASRSESAGTTGVPFQRVSRSPNSEPRATALVTPTRARSRRAFSSTSPTPFRMRRSSRVSA